MTPRPAALQPPQERRRSTRQREQAKMMAMAGHDPGEEKQRKKVSKTTISDAHQCTCQQDSSHAQDAAAHLNHHHADGFPIAKAADEAGIRMDANSSSTSSSDRKGKGRELSSSSSSYKVVNSHQTPGHGVDDGWIPRSSSSSYSYGTRPVERGRKRLLSSREPSPHGLDRSALAYSAPSSYLASASTLPWAIGANDDALPNALAFRFVRNGNIDDTTTKHEGEGEEDSGITTSYTRHTAQSSSNNKEPAVTPPKEEEALALAPFLFDTSDGDELHPVGSVIRRSSSLPASLSAVARTNEHPGQSQLDDWLKSTSSSGPSFPPAEGASPSSSSSTSNSRSSGSGTTIFSSPNRKRKDSSNESNSTNTNITSPPTSPTSSNERSTSSSPKATSISQTTTSITSLNESHKRSSPSLILDTVRLKKRKLSHRIRSFLLLRPPGLPYPGTDGAADILHITRAPAWLKNATSELSRESRMAPHEHYWSGYEADADEWCITPLEKEFKKLMKINAERDAFEVDEREGLSEGNMPYDTGVRYHSGTETDVDMNDKTCSKQDSGSKIGLQDTQATVPSLPFKRRSRRLRQVSAPPVMEADPSKVANALISPPMHDPSHNAQDESQGSQDVNKTGNELPSPPLLASTQSAIPPEVLKSQLLAVLRSRLPEGAKNSDAPLRMKKFVVWNAWIRRSTISNSRPRYRRRSTSAEASEVKTEDRRNRREIKATSLSPPSAQVVIPEVKDDYTMLVDSSLAHQNNQEQRDEGHFDPYGMTSIPDDSEELGSSDQRENGTQEGYNAQDPSMSSTALGLMLHDETSSTARRFSMAFAEEEEEEEDKDDQDDSSLNYTGPFTGSRSRLLRSTDDNDMDAMHSQETAPLVLSPSPIHPTNSSHYSHSMHNASFAAENSRGEYASASPPSSHPGNDERTLYQSRHETDRPMSPLRIRMEQKSSTATPPSFSANLQDQEESNHHGMENHEEATIVPFWFDQESVTFDSEDEDVNEDQKHGQSSPSASSARILTNVISNKSYTHHNPDAFATTGEASPSKSSTECKGLASRNTSRADRPMRDTWSPRNGRGVAA